MNCRVAPSPLARRCAAVSLVVLLVVVSAACSSSGSSAKAATFQAHGSAEQVWLVDATPGATMSLRQGSNTVQSAKTDANGSLIFRNVKPGDYKVREDAGGNVSETKTITVMSLADAPPDPTTLYQQSFPIDPKTNSGYGYITTRDGTKLAAYVQLPGPPDKGPYPTVIEYSGYGEADPAGSGTSISRIPQAVGYATVGVNMRGTGCSGGVYDFFEPLQSLDGYDVVEAIARQPWVMHHKVALTGISYPGISQLYVGATNPPSLAAITPLSVLDDVYRGVLYPGGFLNNGFALSWGLDRVHDSKKGGQPWSAKRMKDGDQTCIANQKLRLQAPNLLTQIGQNDFYSTSPALAARYVPASFVNKIRVPVFLACQWQDDQTGGRCAHLAALFTGTKKAWFTFTNGVHTDSLDPATLTRWYDFLELYLAQRAPSKGAALHAIAPVIYQTAMHIDGVQIPPDPIQSEPSYEAALKAFEALPQVRILFENGAGAQPGYPVPTFEKDFPSWPGVGDATFQAIPTLQGVKAQAWYFQPGGGLAPGKPGATSVNTYQYDPSARPRTNFSGGTSDTWVALPKWNWTPLAPGKAVAYLSAPLDHDETMVGTGNVDLWLKSTAPDTDLQVTLSEARPDGQEMYVQNGWLRASMRKLDTKASSELSPIPTFLKPDVSPLPAGQWSEVQVPIFPFAHLFHKGSQIRISVEAPGGDRPFWAFAALPPKGNQVNSVALGGANASRVVLPLLTDAGATPPSLPPCPSLRGMPCRAMVPFTNTAAAS